MRLLLLATVLAAAVTGCAAVPDRSVDAPPAIVPALLLGEQHDAAEHQQLHQQVVEALAERQLLAALVIEMAEQGRSTAGVPVSAGDDEVKRALGWDKWPWDAYRAPVMTAVRYGVPVIGGNLPRDRMRPAMADTSLDQLIPEAALRKQYDGIRTGHCGLLPETQIPGMTRIQIARDRAMAQAISGAVVPGKTVVLLAGANHVSPTLGVPLHLPARVAAQPVVLTPVNTGKDYCADLRKQMPPQPTTSPG